jgi:hypothetical protein
VRETAAESMGNSRATGPTGNSQTILRIFSDISVKFVKLRNGLRKALLIVFFGLKAKDAA